MPSEKFALGIMQLTVAGPQFLSVSAAEIAVTTKHHDMEMPAKSLTERLSIQLLSN